MKKTLLAMAVLAASGASFAQVTISGSLIMGYKATKSTGTSDVVAPGPFVVNRATSGADASGFGVDTSEIDFAIAEDLGGGAKNRGQAGFGRSGPQW